MYNNFSFNYYRHIKKKIRCKKILIGITLMILIVLTLLSLILGENFLSGIINLSVDNEALIDGVPSTFVVASQDVLFFIDTSNLLSAGIALLITIAVVAGLSGITFLGSGLNPQSARIIILLTAFGGIWGVLSILASSLIFQIEVFGVIIYISLTIAYSIGVVQQISGGND